MIMVIIVARIAKVCGPAAFVGKSFSAGNSVPCSIVV